MGNNQIYSVKKESGGKGFKKDLRDERDMTHLKLTKEERVKTKLEKGRKYRDPNRRVS